MGLISRSFVQIICNFAMIFLLISYIFANDNPVEESEMSAANKLLNEADGLFSLRKYDESRELYFKAINEAKDSDNLSIQTEALAMIARTYLAIDDLKNALIWLDKAKQTAKPESPLGSRVITPSQRPSYVRAGPEGTAMEITHSKAARRSSLPSNSLRSLFIFSLSVAFSPA